MILNKFSLLAGGKQKIDISGATVTTTGKTYNGSNQTTTITVKYAGVTLINGTDYTLSGTKRAKNAGTYTVDVNGIGKYTGRKSATWKINQKKITTWTLSVSPDTLYKSSATTVTAQATGLSPAPDENVQIQSKVIANISGSSIQYTASKTNPKTTFSWKAGSSSSQSSLPRTYFYLMSKNYISGDKKFTFNLGD